VVGFRKRLRDVKRIALSLLVCCALLLPQWLRAQDLGLVVLYPELEEPERGVFTLLRAGIQGAAARAGVPVTTIELPESISTGETAAHVRARMPRAVIALGRRAYQLANAMQLETPVLVAGVDLPVGSTGVNGISLAPNPRIVLATLRSVAPQIRRVIVVVDPTRDRWLLEPATAAARGAGLQLQVHEASNVGEAGAHFLNIFRYGNPRTDAIWLLEDGRFITSDTLPPIIEESWSKNFVVFSNVLAHVRKGALFAHYPDPRPLGERLAQLAVREPSGPPRMRFLDDVKRASNVRVGAHLGPVVNNAQLGTFDIVLGRE
jgi:putative ABC transport system substrate-binding protein